MKNFYYINCSPYYISRNTIKSLPSRRNWSLKTPCKNTSKRSECISETKGRGKRIFLSQEIFFTRVESKNLYMKKIVLFKTHYDPSSIIKKSNSSHIQQKYGKWGPSFLYSIDRNRSKMSPSWIRFNLKKFGPLYGSLTFSDLTSGVNCQVVEYDKVEVVQIKVYTISLFVTSNN